MTRSHHLFALTCGLAALADPAHAATCTEITTAPAVISSPGSYCLAANLTTAITSGNLVSINASDVDLDCKGHALVNTQTSPTGSGVGIYLRNRRNVNIHDCHVRGGFAIGIYADQDNGLANQTLSIGITGNVVTGTNWVGITAWGSDLDIGRNRVHAIGGKDTFAAGIRVGGSNVAGQPTFVAVHDNIVSAVRSASNNAYGIYSDRSDRSDFSGNTLSGIASTSPLSYYGQGIRIAQGGNNRIVRNYITGSGRTNEQAINSQDVVTDACYDNHLRMEFGASCNDALGNY